MKRIVLAIAAVCTLTAAQAQDSIAVKASKAPGFNLGSWMKQNKVFQNLDVSLTAGTTGIGIDVASKIGDYVQLRAGYEYMPRFNKSIYFPIEVGGSLQNCMMRMVIELSQVLTACQNCSASSLAIRYKTRLR